MRKKIVLISCVSKKLTDRAKAKELYTSTLFKFNLKYAELLAPDEIFILSAKHGLLTLNQEIEPYDETLNTMKSAEIKMWSDQVLEQIKGVCAIDDSEFVFLAGEKYRKHLLPHINNYKIPLKGFRIGEQLKQLKKLTS